MEKKLQRNYSKLGSVWYEIGPHRVILDTFKKVLIAGCLTRNSHCGRRVNTMAHKKGATHYHAQLGLTDILLL